jgi:hypothetical protein
MGFKPLRSFPLGFLADFTVAAAKAGTILASEWGDQSRALTQNKKPVVEPNLDV